MTTIIVGALLFVAASISNHGRDVAQLRDVLFIGAFMALGIGLDLTIVARSRSKP